MRILHLSDTHVSGPEGPDAEGIDARAVLDGLLHDCRHVEGIDLVVVSGDVTDDGSRAGYRAVRERVGAFATARGAAVVYATGNHDDRDAFRAELGVGHFDATGQGGGRALLGEQQERAAISIIDEVRVITLDSLIPGRVEGVISTHQLEALSAELASPLSAGRCWCSITHR